MRKNTSAAKARSKKPTPLKVLLPMKNPSQTKRSVQQQLHKKIYGKQSKSSYERQKSRYSFRQLSKNKQKDLQTSNLSKRKEQNMKGKKSDQTTMTEPNDHNLRFQFDSAVSKIFNIIDIFSRGTISEANINKWVPEAALYFLGSVFQKIRNTRNTYTRDQFQEQCVKLFRKSSENDIKEFINKIKQIQNENEEKISLDGENTTSNKKQKTIESRVEDRFIFPQDGQTSFRNMRIQFNPQKTMPVRLNEPLYNPNKNNNNLQTLKIKHDQNIPKDIYIQEKRIKKNGDWNKIRSKLPEPLKNIDQYENVGARTMLNVQKRVTVQGINHLEMPLQISSSQVKTPNARNYYEDQKCKTININGVDSPHFQVDFSLQFKKKLFQGQNKKEGADKIDELSLRLQSFIKQNAARLQRSKNARIQL